MCHSVFDLQKSPLWQCKHGCRKKEKRKKKKEKEKKKEKNSPVLWFVLEFHEESEQTRGCVCL
jgi:hypothetical protein